MNIKLEKVINGMMISVNENSGIQKFKNYLELQSFMLMIIYHNASALDDHVFIVDNSDLKEPSSKLSLALTLAFYRET